MVNAKPTSPEAISLRRSELDQLTFGKKMSNAAGAGGRVASAVLSGKKITVSAEEKERRMAICAACEFFTGVTCSKCGCVARFKTKLATESCPIGRW